MEKLLQLEYDDRGAATHVRFPRFLFRYRKLDDILLSSVVDATMWFAHQKDFNDPFEGHSLFDTSNTLEEVTGYISELLAAMVEAGELKRLASEIATGLLRDDASLWKKTIAVAHEERLRLIAFCCFSTVCDNTLMWSHYADSHRGVCLAFDSAELALSGQFSPLEIEYFERIPLFNYVRERSAAGRNDLFNQRFDQALMGRKNTEWSYEREIRLMSPHQGKNTYPRTALRGIIFGAKVDRDEREKLVRALRENYDRVDFAQAILEMDSGRVLVPEARNYLVRREISRTGTILRPAATAPSAVGLQNARQEIASSLASHLKRSTDGEDHSAK